jgi:hypothetical protein
MAWAIIGGLTASTFLTLVIVPVVYSLLDRLRRKHAHREVAAPEHVVIFVDGKPVEHKAGSQALERP